MSAESKNPGMTALEELVEEARTLRARNAMLEHAITWACLALRVDPESPLTAVPEAEAERRAAEVLWGKPSESWTQRIYTPPTPAGMAALRHYSDECDQLRARIKVLEDRAKVDAERRSRDEADLKALRGFAREVLGSGEPNRYLGGGSVLSAIRAAYVYGLVEDGQCTRILTGDDPQAVQL